MTLPSPPRPVMHDVVSADVADAELRATREAVASLEAEWRDIEARVAAAESRADTDGAESPLAQETLAAVEAIAEAYTASARAEMRATLEQAEEAAARRILDAEAEAAAIAAALRSELSLALLAGTDGALEQLLDPLQPATPPETDDDDVVIDLRGRTVDEKEGKEEAEADADLEPEPAPPAALGTDDAAFQRFWTEPEPPPAPVRNRTSFWPVEALLPILALSLLLVVALVLIG